ncbi:MAG TPA: ROK family protein [Tepidisphaeraceae bacterium]|jgi:glucokinase
MDYALGIDVGATNVKAVAVTTEGEVFQQDRFSTRDHEAGAWMEAIREYVRLVETKHGSARRLGVACPGLAARDGRTIAWMRGRMSAVEGLDWTELLGRRELTPVLNDAHAALLGELWLGVGGGASNAAMLTLGTGVGGAVMCDGRLLKGALGRAGHLGHITLNFDGRSDIVGMPGSLEDAIGECTIAARSDGRFESTMELLQAVRAGDEHALRVWLASIKALAAGIGSIINCVDPEVVILGGGVARAGRLLLEPLERYMNQFEWRPFGEPVRIVLASVGEYAGALGAARNAMQI